VDFTAAWAANFAASLTLSLLASSPEAQHRGTSPATPGSSWSSTTPAGCPGRPQRSTWPEPPWSLVRRARGGVRQAFAARTRATRRTAPAWTPVWSFRRA